MKTLSEHEAERHAAREAQDKENDSRRVRLNKWMDDLEAKNIPPYVLLKDGTDYSQYRAIIRDAVRSGYASKYNLACDHCGTELVNNEPGMRTLSNPSKSRISCPGCGWTGFIS